MAISTQEISPGVYRFADGLVNLYVIEDDGELTLVDTGWPWSWSSIESAVNQLGRSRETNIRAVVLTHGHPDHLGTAEKARQEYGATVWAYQGEVSRVRGEAKGSAPITLVPALLPHLWRPSSLGFVLHATVRGFLTPTWVKEVESFEAGEELDVPGRLRPIRTPGHTEGHVSLLLADQGILFAGDALLTLDPLTRAEGPRLPPDALNFDPAQVRASLDALEKADAGTLLPGHGEPWTGSMTDAVARAREASGS